MDKHLKCPNRQKYIPSTYSRRLDTLKLFLNSLIKPYYRFIELRVQILDIFTDMPIPPKQERNVEMLEIYANISKIQAVS